MTGLPPAPPARRAVNVRSVLIGTIGVIAVSAITPYNDIVINNSLLTGSFFPPAITLAIVLGVIFNTLLRRFAPSRAMSGGEFAVVLSMLLAGCAVPGLGLMRSLIALPVTFHYQGQSDEAFWAVFQRLDLPDWLFAADPVTGRDSSVVRDFFGRTPEGGDLPWHAWVRPLLGWGAFVFCLFGALLGLAPILRQQWAVNERLAFPLAEVGGMLIDPPEPGRLVNRLIGNPTFWVTAGIVFFLQSLVALHAYHPQAFPPLSFTFDLTNKLTEPPWTNLISFVKRSTIYFTFVGVTYFVPSRVGLSLWSIFLIEQFIAMGIRTAGGDVQNGMWNDQHLGACVALLVGILWVGRRSWAEAARQAVGRAPREDAVPMATEARLFLAGTIGMFAWLLIVGVGLLPAAAIVAVILAVHVVVARVVTETGLPFVRVMPTFPQIATNFSPTLLTGRDVFFGSVSSLFGPLATRESLLPHALNGLQIGDRENASRPLAMLGVMGWALGVAFVVSAAAMLWCQYGYASSLNEAADRMENVQGALDIPRNYVTGNVVDHAAGRYPQKSHSAVGQMTLGFVITGVLQLGVLRYASWPFVPVGYLISHTWYAQMAWWSILLGWLAKVIILRLGGAKAYQSCKPAFVGLIVGEALATGFWLLVALILVWAKQPYEVVNFLP